MVCCGVTGVYQSAVAGERVGGQAGLTKHLIVILATGLEVEHHNLLNPESSLDQVCKTEGTNVSRVAPSTRACDGLGRATYSTTWSEQEGRRGGIQGSIAPS